VAVERSSDTYVSRPMYSDSKNEQRASSKPHQDSDGLSLIKPALAWLLTHPTQDFGLPRLNTRLMMYAKGSDPQQTHNAKHATRNHYINLDLHDFIGWARYSNGYASSCILGERDAITVLMMLRACSLIILTVGVHRWTHMCIA
jgi:hypothetical protein